MLSVDLEEVTLAYESNGERVVAVSEASMHLNSGDRVLIEGPSGSGKSSLLSAMAGLLRPQSGRLVISGVPSACGKNRLVLNDLSADERANYRRENIALMLQGYDLLQGFTVEENLAIAEMLAGHRADEGWKAHCIQRLGLQPLMERSGLELSGGQRQRAALCRALVMRSPVMLIDEPTSALDPVNTTSVCELLDSISERAILVCVSHDPNFGLVDSRRFSLQNGQLTEKEKL